MIKALTQWQPWATLSAIGAKRIETRSWSTKHRGLMLIHASLKFNKELALGISRIGAYDILADAGYDWMPCGKPTTLPLGAIIGHVQLVDVLRTDDMTAQERGFMHTWTHPATGATGYHQLTDQERAFGDYSPGRFAWLMADPVLLPGPIPRKGWQGLWNCDLPAIFISLPMHAGAQPGTDQP